MAFRRRGRFGRRTRRAFGRRRRRVRSVFGRRIGTRM